MATLAVESTPPRAHKRSYDPIRVAVKTAPGGRDGHVHCAIVDDDGNGRTSPGPDGHTHRVVELEVSTSRGHRHELSARRCDARHNDRGNHVQARTGA